MRQRKRGYKRELNEEKQDVIVEGVETTRKRREGKILKSLQSRLPNSFRLSLELVSHTLCCCLGKVERLRHLLD